MTPRKACLKLSWGDGFREASSSAGEGIILGPDALHQLCVGCITEKQGELSHIINLHTNTIHDCN